jgi:hypothetical protein
MLSLILTLQSLQSDYLSTTTVSSFPNIKLHNILNLSIATPFSNNQSLSLSKGVALQGLNCILDQENFIKCHRKFNDLNSLEQELYGGVIMFADI